MIKLGLSLLAGPSGHAYLGSCFEMSISPDGHVGNAEARLNIILYSDWL